MSALADTWDELDQDLTHVDGSELLGDNPDPTLPDRMLRAVARERRKVAQAEAVVAAEKERLDTWLHEQRARHDTSFLEAALAGYHEARLARDPRARTIHLPSGTLVARQQPDRWEIDDEVLLDWAALHFPGLVRTKVEVDRATTKKALTVTDDGSTVTADGDPVPGVLVEPGGIGFTVKPSEDLLA